MNIFGNYNYNRGDNLSNFNSTSNRFDTLFEQKNRIVFQNNSHGFKGGLDYFMGAKSTIGAVVSGNVASNDVRSSGPMVFTYIPTGQVDRVLDAQS